MRERRAGGSRQPVKDAHRQAGAVGFDQVDIEAARCALRLAAARLHQEDAVKVLFNEIAPAQKGRNGGYTRIIKLYPRQGDAAEQAILEWVDAGSAAEAAPAKEEAATAEKK